MPIYQYIYVLSRKTHITKNYRRKYGKIISNWQIVTLRQRQQDLVRDIVGSGELQFYLCNLNSLKSYILMQMAYIIMQFLFKLFLREDNLSVRKNEATQRLVTGTFQDSKDNYEEIVLPYISQKLRMVLERQQDLLSG